MTMQVINIGTVPNDHTGDPLRTAFDKCNTNFAQVGTLTAKLSYSTGLTSVNDLDFGSGFPTGVGRGDITGTGGVLTITGMLAGTDGQQILLRNIGASNIILSINDAGSVAANQFLGLGTSLMLLPSGGRTLAVYQSGPTPGWSIG